jgi:DNA invertase Pin-like site-specific DNA recombinase
LLRESEPFAQMTAKAGGFQGWGRPSNHAVRQSRPNLSNPPVTTAGLGAVAELERSLIVERVKAGERNARAKGKCIGRPPRTFLTPDVRKSIGEAYRNEEGSLRQLAARFGTSVGMVQRCTRTL